MEPRKETRAEKIVMAIVEVLIVLSAITALYSLIWANWPAFQLSLTIFVTMVLGYAFGYWIVDFLERITKK